MRKGDMRKQELLHQAEQLFFTKGYAETSVNDILLPLGCSKGSFYHHFENKLAVLSALCEKHAQDAFERYQSRARLCKSDAEKLELLLYHSLPVCPEEKQMCALLLPLMPLPDAHEVLSALLAAQRKLFLTEMTHILQAMQADHRAFYPCDALPETIWDAHTGLYQRLLDMGCKIMEDPRLNPIPRLRDMLEAERYLFERLLDLPFGSVTVISLPVCADTLQRAAVDARQKKDPVHNN